MKLSMVARTYAEKRTQAADTLRSTGRATIHQTALLLGVSPVIVRRVLANHSLPVLHIGSRVFVTASTLEQLKQHFA